MSQRVTVREAAQILDVSEATVRRRINKGDLDAIKSADGKRGPVWMVALSLEPTQPPPDTPSADASGSTSPDLGTPALDPALAEVLRVTVYTFIPGAFAFGIVWGLTGIPILGVFAWIAIWAAESWRAGVFEGLAPGSPQPGSVGD